MAGESLTGPFVFVSHASEDKQTIRPYLEKMITAGIGLFIDRPGDVWADWDLRYPDRVVPITPGTDWDDEIRGALEPANCIVVFLSRSFMRKHEAPGSNVIRREVDYARQTGKYRPLLIDPFTDVPKDERDRLFLHFEYRQYEDLTKALLSDTENKTGLVHPTFDTVIRQILKHEPEVSRQTTARRWPVSVLPSLINRRFQEEPLRSAFEAKDPATKPPTYAVCAQPEEDFVGFLCRVAMYTLTRDKQGAKRPDGEEGGPFSAPWPLPDESPEERWNWYLNDLKSLLDVPEAEDPTPAAIAERLFGKARTWLVYSFVEEADWANEPLQLIDAWRTFWTMADRRFAELSAPAGGGRLLALLCVQTSTVIKDLPRRADMPPGLVVLQGLEPVRSNDMTEWCGKYRRELSATTSAKFMTLFKNPDGTSRNLSMSDWLEKSSEKLRELRVK